ncbi:MAG: copper-translocating P-type ATPase [Clostridia bacterium]|nr:copper-translocating P-type ATPase [Clostridia bacterium]
MKKIILKIEGMTCSACSNGLEKYLNKQDGILSASVNLVMANAQIEYDETKIDKKKLDTFVKKAGFKSLGIYEDTIEEKKTKSEKNQFVIFSILAILLLYISMGHMMGLPIVNFLNMHTNPVNYAITLCFLTILFLLYGWDILKNGYKSLLHKAPNMDTLVAIGVMSSFLYSLYSMVMIGKGNPSYVHELYFESAAIVIFFIKLGRYLDGISKDKTKEAIQKLVQITPSKAIIKVEGKEKEVTIDEIQRGDIVISYAGDRIAVDGEIVEGKAHLDESFMTGESKPVNKTKGNKVIAGTINYDGYLEYKAEKIGKDSTISQIVKLVVEATNTKAPIAKIADKVSGYFVPVVMMLAIITLIAYLVLGFEIGTAVITFVTVLVVACPCALGLATPLAIVVSEGICANHGILVKKSEILENAEKIDTIIFDKTGTLTYGKLKIAEIINHSRMQAKELLQLAGSLEAKSTHPIAQAFSRYLKENKIETLEVESFENRSGYGIIGKVKGKDLMLGNYKMLEQLEMENPYKEEEKKLSQKGNSIIYVVQDKKIIGIIGVNDIIRQNAKKVVERLNQKKIETIMVTGDNQETAHRIAKQIGIKKVIADVLPTQKGDVIRNLKKQGKRVMMCGDGINDSPALASSDIGVSVNSGTDIAMDSSDVILMKNDLSKILDLIQISKKTIRNVKQNLFWAFFYNSLMLPISMGLLKPFGIAINPMIAGLAMVFSSLTVIINALRLKGIKLEGSKVECLEEIK